MTVTEGREPTKVERKRFQTRVALRSTAYDLISTQGVDATTIQHITDAANVGFGTFYNYFPSKDALALDVLDCVIHNIGERNDLVTKQKTETDAVAIVANSCRFVIREMTTNPMWRWWLARLDLLVDRMRAGFGPFGLRDISDAVRAGEYHLIANNPTLAWSQLVWLLAGSGKDIADGHIARESEAACAEAMLRVMGVDHEHAHAVTMTALLPSPILPIDFSFELS